MRKLDEVFSLAINGLSKNEVAESFCRNRGSNQVATLGSCQHKSTKNSPVYTGVPILDFQAVDACTGKGK
jgi:hypothetical protein